MMIADGAQIASTPAIATLPKPKGKPGPKKGSIWGEGSTYQRAQARRLYLVDGWNALKIGPHLDVPIDRVNDWVKRGGWAKLRREALEKSQADIQAQLNAEAAKLYSDVAVECEELTLGSLEFARDRLKQKDAKALSMLSTGIRNFTDTARRIRALDSREGSHSSISLNFISAPRIERPMKVVSAAPIQDAQVAVETVSAQAQKLNDGSTSCAT